MKITIAHMYPDMLNLYGDGGNIAALYHRLAARGIEPVIKAYAIDEDIDFEGTDIIFIGGGGDRENRTACDRLKGQREGLSAYVEDGGVVLAVCGGFELLGKSCETADGEVEALGILNCTAKYNKDKIIGNIVLESELIGTTIVGFENHSCRMDIGENMPLGTVLSGVGNDGSGAEGAVYKNVIATYLHGPLLPKNPALADYIITKAIERKHGKVELPPIDDEAETAAHDYIVGRFISK